MKKDVMNMKKPSDATKLVLKKSRKYIALRGICSLIYRGIAMITPILFSNAVNLITAGKYKSAVIMSIIAIFTPLPVKPCSCKARMPRPGSFIFSVYSSIIARCSSDKIVVLSIHRLSNSSFVRSKPLIS